MRKLFLILLAVSATCLLASAFRIPVAAGEVEVPVVLKMSELLEIVPEDFDANWQGIRVAFDNLYVPFQIEDADDNNRISASDYLVFLAKGNGEIIIPEEDVEPVRFEPSFVVEKVDDNWKITAKDNLLALSVNDHGLAQVTMFNGTEATLLDEIGIARVSGWPESTYWIDGKLGNHYEETSGAFDVVSVKMLEPGPVAIGVVAHLKSSKFNGLNQILAIHIFKNGDILVDNAFHFETYADMMKLQSMVTRPIAVAFDDALHILPVFRRLVWADQLNITPLEYWLQRDAIKYINEKPYIVFPATSTMKPLWWGATYIFASMESWRSNYSPSAKIGVAQILPEVPVVPADYEKWLNGDTWVYESLEFRDGVFKWMPGEFEAYKSTQGVYSMKVEDMPNHYKFGDEVRHIRLYSFYTADDVASAVKQIEKKGESFRNLRIGE